MAKIGEGHASAMLRLGLEELRNAVNPSKESVADSELGLYGTQTQGEIASAPAKDRVKAEQESMTMEELRSAAKEKAKRNENENDQGKDGPDPSRGIRR